MKTRYNLTLIGTVLAIAALSLPFIISETSPKPEIPSTPDHVLIGTLLEFGCSELAINYLMDSSNLLDEEFDGVYMQNFMGLPDGLSDEDFDKCLEIAIFIRENNVTRSADEQLQKVLDHCQKKELAEGELVIYYEDTIPFYYYNTTHYIGTNSCQWHLLENHPDSDILCIPGMEKWVSSEAIRNSTHIYDKSTCQWYRIISSFGDPVYSVPDWEIDYEPEFEVQREIAKQIYKSLPKDDDSPYLGMRLGDDRKSIQFGIDITKLTPEKNKEYYEKLFEEKFSEVISYKIVFKERQGGDE